jgi:hypothetical protein
MSIGMNQTIETNLPSFKEENIGFMDSWDFIYGVEARQTLTADTNSDPPYLTPARTIHSKTRLRHSKCPAACPNEQSE